MEKLHCYGLSFRVPHSHAFTTGKTPLTHYRALSGLAGLFYGRYHHHFPPPRSLFSQSRSISEADRHSNRAVPTHVHAD